MCAHSAKFTGHRLGERFRLYHHADLPHDPPPAGKRGADEEHNNLMPETYLVSQADQGA
jgi:hypothetical protein